MRRSCSCPAAPAGPGPSPAGAASRPTAYSPTGNAPLPPAAPVWETRSVAAFRAGDPILAFDHAAGETRRSRVVRTFARTSDHLSVLTFEAEGGGAATVRTTDEHPFWSADRNEYVRARGLRLGEHCRGADGVPLLLAATEREPHPEGVPVFNLEVDGDHTYFVTPAGDDATPVLAHNTCAFKVSDDSQGRVRSAVGHITLADLGTGTGTNAATRAAARALGTSADDAGHLIGKLLGGPGGVRSRNFFAQNPHINRGQFAQLEGRVADYVRNGHDVWVRVRPDSGGTTSTRASEVCYDVRVDGVTVVRERFGN